MRKSSLKHFKAVVACLVATVLLTDATKAVSDPTVPIPYKYVLDGDDRLHIFGWFSTDGTTVSITGNNNSVTVYDGAKIHGIIREDDNAVIWFNTDDGDINTLNISNNVTNTGDNGYAIKGEDGIEIVNLFSGSEVIGDIDLGSGGDTVDIYGNSNINGMFNLGSGDNEFTLNADADLTVDGNISSGDDNDTFVFDVGSTLTADTINSGAGNDTMTVYEGATINGTIDSGGGNNAIDNRGTISTEGAGYHAIILGSGKNSIVNSGTISTTGTDADGINSSGDNATITNAKNGTIETANATGINSSGEYSYIANYGTITVGEGGFHGISLSGGSDNSTAINFGTIDIQGGQIGMDGNRANNLTLINNYIINTTDTGMLINGGEEDLYSGGTLINNGTINAAGGDHGWGLWSSMSNSTVINSGTISVTGKEMSVGIDVSNNYFDIDNSNTINYGTITVSGGTFRTTGDWDDNKQIGIYVGSAAGTTHTINNYGTITILGEGDGVYAILGAAGEEIVNLFSGSDVTGDIDLGGGSDTMTLHPGSKITGNIYLGKGDDWATIYQGADITGCFFDFGEGNDTLEIDDANVTLTYNTGVNSSGEPEPENRIVNDSSLLLPTDDGTIKTLSKTGQAAKGPVLGNLCGGLHGVVNNRLTHFKPAQIKLAATRITPGMLKTPKQPQAWGDVFRSYRKRDDEGRAPGYDHEFRGFTGGIEQSYKRARVGLLGGYSHAVVKADNKTFKTKSNSYFTGAYGQYDFGRIKLAASLIGGYEDHDNDRYVTDNLFGAETARADFGSIFLSPSVTVSADFTVSHRLLLRPSATVVYSAGWYDDYHETGTTQSNLLIDSRTIQTLNPQLQMAAVYTITDWCELELNAGGKARYMDTGTVNGNVSGGSDFRFTTSGGDDNVYGAHVGGYLSADVTDRLELYINAQFTDATGGETQDFFMAGLKFSY